MAVAIPLVTGLGGAWLGGTFGGMLGASIGYMAGTMVGNYLFPPETGDEIMPSVSSYPFQGSMKGGAIPVIFGTVRMAGNIVWLGPSHSYVIVHKVSGGKGFGGGSAENKEVKYRRSFLVVLCEGPAMVRRMWENKTEIDIASATGVTFFDGSNNEDIDTLLGAEFAQYKNLCCVYFNEYELGNRDALPNFTFEVMNGEWSPEIILCRSRPSGGYQVYFDGIKYRDNEDGTFTQLASNGQGTRPCNSLGFTGDYVYWPRNGTSGYYLDKLHASDLSLVTEWQTGGSKYIYALGGYTVLADPTTKRVFVYGNEGGSYKFFCLDDNGDEIWSVTGSVYTSSKHTSFMADGNVLVRRASNSAPSAYKMSAADGSVLAQYGTDHSDYIQDACENPVNGQVILVGEYNGEDGVHCFPADGGDITDRIWFSPVTCATGHPYAVRCIGGYIYVGSYVATVPAIGTLHKFTSGGDHVASYNTGQPVLMIRQRASDEIVTGGYRGAVPPATEYANLRIFDLDLNYLRGLDWGPNSYGSNKVTAMAFPILPTVDENPSDIIKEILTNTQWGLGKSESELNLDSFATVAAECTSNDLLFSFKLDKQKSAMDWIDYVLAHFNGFIRMSNGLIELGMYRDESSVSDLTADDFVVGDGSENTEDTEPEQPIQVKKRGYKDTINRVELSWTNRDNDYERSVVVANDPVDQRISNKIRTKNVILDGITDGALAQKTAYRMLFEGLYRYSNYGFKLSFKNMLLEPGDVITIDDGDKINEQKIRITEMNESKNGKDIEVSAVEDQPYLYVDTDYDAASSLYEKEEVPTLTSPLAKIIENWKEKLLHIYLTPQDENVNGWAIYLSRDGSEYELLESVGIDSASTACANGELTTSMPAYPAVVHRPDDNFRVDIDEVVQLEDTSDEGLFNNQHLAIVEDEIIGYRDVTDIGSGVWEISNIIRGLFNTEAVEHAATASFVTMKNCFNYEFLESDIGRTLSFKFLTFYKTNVQQLDDVSEETYIVQGEYKKPAPASLIRINGREGFGIYSDPVTIDWYVASKTMGFNLENFNWDNSTILAWPDTELAYNEGVDFGSYIADTELEAIVVRIEESDTTLIMEEELVATDESEQYAYVADFNSKDPVRIKIIPRRIMRSSRENNILITKE